MDGKQQKLIFVVDDDPMFQSMLKDHLADNNPHFNVMGFLSGEDCLEHLSQKPDAVILDYFLDNVEEDAANGLEILKQIKDQYPEMPVVMLSAQHRYGVAAQTLIEGAYYYIIKDDDAFEKVNEMINELLEEAV
ncbi:MAG: response regulator [Chitinophagales bacterium]